MKFEAVLFKVMRAVTINCELTWPAGLIIMCKTTMIIFSALIHCPIRICGTIFKQLIPPSKSLILLRPFNIAI